MKGFSHAISLLIERTSIQIPGNVLAGNWRAVFYIDDQATPEQREALLNVFSGKLGGLWLGSPAWSANAWRSTSYPLSIGLRAGKEPCVWVTSWNMQFQGQEVALFKLGHLLCT